MSTEWASKAVHFPCCHVDICTVISAAEPSCRICSVWTGEGEKKTSIGAKKFAQSVCWVSDSIVASLGSRCTATDEAVAV